MIDTVQTNTLKEIWVECDCCRLRMFYGFAPASRADVQNSFGKDGWTFRADGTVRCDYCTEKDKTRPVLEVI